MSNESVLLLLDGEVPQQSVLRKAVAHSQYIIATDGAALIAKQYSIALDAIVGDMDSLDDVSSKFFRDAGIKIVKDADQYSNDFEKALQFLIDNNKTDSLTILGMHGKRTDHTLTNLSVLVRFRDKFSQLVSIDDFHEHRLLTKTFPVYVASLKRGSQISLTPLPIAQGVQTHGLFYPINNKRMEFGINEGLSNIIDSDSEVSISITGGALLVSTPHEANE